MNITSKIVKRAYNLNNLLAHLRDQLSSTQELSYGTLKELQDQMVSMGLSSEDYRIVLDYMENYFKHRISMMGTGLSLIHEINSYLNFKVLFLNVEIGKTEFKTQVDSIFKNIFGISPMIFGMARVFYPRKPLPYNYPFPKLFKNYIDFELEDWMEGPKKNSLEILFPLKQASLIKNLPPECNIQIYNQPHLEVFLDKRLDIAYYSSSGNIHSYITSSGEYSMTRPSKVYGACAIHPERDQIDHTYIQGILND